MAGDGLDPVVQQFVADTEEYIANLEAATEAANQFRDANLEAAAAVKTLQDQLDDADGSTEGYREALNGVRDALAEDDEIQNRYMSNLRDLKDTEVEAAATSRELDAALRDLDAEFGTLLFASDAANNQLGDLQATFRDLHEAMLSDEESLDEVRDKILEAAAAAGFSEPELLSLAEAFNRVRDAAFEAADAQEDEAAASDTDAFSGALAGLAGVAGTAGTALAGLSGTTWLWIAAIATLGPEVIGLLGAIAGLIPGIFAVIGGMGSLAAVFYEAYKHVASFHAEVHSALSSVEGDLANLGKTLAPVLGPLVRSLQGVAEAIIRYIGPAAKAAAEALTPLLQAFSRFLDSSGFAQDMAQMTAAIGPALDGLAQLAHIVMDVGRNMMDVLAPAMQPAITFFNEFARVLGGVLINLLGQFARTLEEFAKPLTSLLPLLGGTVKAFLDLAGTLVRGLLPAFIDITRTVLPTLTHLFRELEPQITPLAHALNGVVKAVLPLIPALVRLALAFEPLIPAVADFVKAMTPVIHVASEVIVWLLKIISDALLPLAMFFTIAVQSILGVIQVLAHWIAWLGNQFAIFWDDLVRDTEHGVTAAVAWMNRLPVDFHNAVDDFGNLLFSAGEALMHGLLDGIEAAVGPVISFISHIASEISGAFSRVLHIFSPSLVFHEHGLMMMAGLAEGIAAGYPLARAALAAVAEHLVAAGRPQLPPALATAPAGAAVGAGGAPTITVNLTVQGSVIAEQDLKAQVQEAMLDAWTRTGATGFTPYGHPLR